MTKKTLVLIERMFLTPESVFVLQLRMALPATVFVATVLAAPESSSSRKLASQMKHVSLGAPCAAHVAPLTSAWPTGSAGSGLPVAWSLAGEQAESRSRVVTTHASDTRCRFRSVVLLIRIPHLELRSWEGAAGNAYVQLRAPHRLRCGCGSAKPTQCAGAPVAVRNWAAHTRCGSRTRATGSGRPAPSPAVGRGIRSAERRCVMRRDLSHPRHRPGLRECAFPWAR